MNGEQRVVYVSGMLLKAQIEMNAMVAANLECSLYNEVPKYKETDFRKLTEDFVNHNTILTELFGD